MGTCLENIIENLNKYFFNNTKEKIFFLNAEDRKDGRISSVPFHPDEFNDYCSKDEEAQKEFVSTGFIFYFHSDIKKNIEAIKKVGYYDFYNKQVNEILNMATDKFIVVFAILHEVGHWKHFCETGKKPYQFHELYNKNNTYCEMIADQFALDKLPEFISALTN